MPESSAACPRRRTVVRSSPSDAGQGHALEVRTTGDDHSVTVTCPVEVMELIMSEDGRELTGTYEGENYSCVAEYTYD